MNIAALKYVDASRATKRSNVHSTILDGEHVISLINEVDGQPWAIFQHANHTTVVEVMHSVLAANKIDYISIHG